MKRLIGLMSAGLLTFMLACLVLTGCGKDPSIELSVEGNVYEVTPGGSLQFNASVKELNETELQYTVNSQDAQISNTGLLTVDTDIAVPSTITVVAKIGNVSSNIVSVNVVDLKPTSITLVPDNTKLAKGGDIAFNVTYNPTYATVKDYTLSIAGGTGADLVELNNGVLTIKNSVDNATATGKTVNVKATLNGDDTISSTTTIELVDAEGVDTLIANNISMLYSQNRSIIVNGLNEAGDIITLDSANISYTSSNENVAFVRSDGSIQAKGHGTTTVTINYAGKTTTCQVAVMVPPTGFSIDNVSTYISNGGTFSFSKVDPLKLDLEIVNPTFSNRCSKDVDYTFALYDEEGVNVLATGDDVATVNDSGINFKVTGNVEIVISSNSSIGGALVPANKLPDPITLNVNVNNGINVDTVAEFKAFSEQDENPVCNLLADIKLTATENFGFNGQNPAGLHFYGDRYLNGNGYVLSLTELPLGDNTSDDSYTLLKFSYDRYIGQTAKYWALENPNDKGFTVQITNFEVLGNTGIWGDYTGELEQFKGQSVMISGNYRRTYDRAIEVAGGEYNVNDTAGAYKSHIEDFLLDNVKVSGFQVGLRLKHIVSGTATGIDISNCLSNGIELVQNIITLNNVRVGQVGAFGIEITPDEMVIETDGNLNPTAGVDYNQKPVTNLTGYIDITNYNNGASTPYMQAFTLEGLTLIEVLDQVVGAQIQEKTQDVTKQTELLQLFNSIAKKGDAVNLYVLIFINPEDAPAYAAGGAFEKYGKIGNVDECLMEYTFDSSEDNMINVKDVFDKYLQNPSDETYRTKQYICLDLDISAFYTSPTGKANIGQVILVNEQYQAD